MGSKVGKTVKGVKGGKPVPKARGKVGKPAISSRPSRSGVKAVNYNVDDALKSALAHCAPAKKTKSPLALKRDEAKKKKQDEKGELRRLAKAHKAFEKKKKQEMPRGPRDSGKGVRIQGGKVYDSNLGVTCHWCRQKTLEAQLECTHPECGLGSRGKRMPTSFCGPCLRNRHGEDIEEARASGVWVCPPCRGSCGKGCAGCCSCSLCRKAVGLDATGHIIDVAKRAGFGNVHDYLVHLTTGESPEAIWARKKSHPFGLCRLTVKDRLERKKNGKRGVPGKGGAQKSIRTALKPSTPRALPAVAQEGGSAGPDEARVKQILREAMATMRVDLDGFDEFCAGMETQVTLDSDFEFYSDWEDEPVSVSS